MPFGAVDFSNKQTSGLDPLAGVGAHAINVIREASGAVRRRPGIVAHAEAPEETLDGNPISGIHVTQAGLLFAVSETGAERVIYRVSGGVAADLGPTAPYGLRGTGRPVFSETEALLVLAGGSLIQKVELDGNVSSRLGGSPPDSTHVIAIASRLAVNDLDLDRSKIVYSGVAAGTLTYAGHEQWSTGIGLAGFISAEGRPDPIVALHENTNEIFAFGSTTLQVFAPDPTLTFAPVASREFGCSAPYSVVKSDQQFMWLDDRRRFVISDARSHDVISDPIKQTLDDLERVDDCFGYRVVMGPLDAIVWTFPTGGVSFCFQKGSGWSQWQGWNGNWTQFAATAHFHRSDLNKNVVGLEDGRIAELSFASQTDLGDPINASVTSGYENRATDNLKHCIAVRVALRRGESQSATGPIAWLTWRDRPGAWQGRIPVSLGRSSDTEIVVSFRSLGTYRRRQWGFEFTGTEALVLVGVTEEYEVLET